MRFLSTPASNLTAAGIISALGYTPAPLGGYRAFDADAVAWYNAVLANGGTVSLNRLIIVDQFIFSEKAAGLWTLTDDYLGFWAENAAQALTSLKQRRLATAVNSPTFTVDRDYTFNGTTSYADTGFVPGTHAVSMSAQNAHLEVYERTSTNVANDTAGVQDTAARAINIQSRSSGTMNAGANTTGASYTLVTATSLGLSQVGRLGPLASDQYGAKNGTTLSAVAPPSVIATALPTFSFFVGGTNASVLARPRACSVGYIAWGAALDSTQRLARYNNVQTWATAVGAQV